MSTIGRLACLLRGHAWNTVEDPYGSVTTCSRCAKLRRQRGGGGTGREAASEWDSFYPNTGGGE
jgi:hypothetical protein